MAGEGKLRVAAQAYDKARDRLARVWEDDRAMRMRAEVLHPLAKDLDVQVRAQEMWARHHEAAGTCLAAIEESLENAGARLTECAEEEQRAKDHLTEAASALDTGTRAVAACDERCEQAWRELEAAVPCGGRIPVSYEVWAEASLTAAKVVALEGAKLVAGEALEVGVGHVLGVPDPDGTEGVDDQLADQVIDAGRLTAVRSRAWWERFRKRRDRR